jgi:transcriptional regulator
MKNKRLNDSEVEQVLKLKVSGLSPTKIAEKFETTRQKIRNIIKKEMRG